MQARTQAACLCVRLQRRQCSGCPAVQHSAHPWCFLGGGWRRWRRFRRQKPPPDSVGNGESDRPRRPVLLGAARFNYNHQLHSGAGASAAASPQGRPRLTRTSSSPRAFSWATSSGLENPSSTKKPAKGKGGSRAGTSRPQGGCGAGSGGTGSGGESRGGRRPRTITAELLEVLLGQTAVRHAGALRRKAFPLPRRGGQQWKFGLRGLGEFCA